ncbi:hypothetical protein AB0M68_20940 [Streptomyces sp. NPDC051453]|uniref:hypothetical protein n=1 Tax=Streptomyces sp. NPDC051453 TaxID=3154941 RepID=UPI003416946F
MTQQSVPVTAASAPRRRTVLGGLGAGVVLAATSGALNTVAAAGRGSSSGDGCRASVTYCDKRILISADAG